MENKNKPTLQQILSTQVTEILNQSGIGNLVLEQDGTVSGEQQTIDGDPHTNYLKNIRLVIKDGKIVMVGMITNSVTDAGKVI